MRYENFTIQIGPTTSEGTHVQVSCDLGGDDFGRLGLGTSLDHLRIAFAQATGAGYRNVVPWASASEPLPSLEAIGQELFERVFRDGPLGVLERSIGSLARERRRGIRLRIRTDPRDRAGAELQSLPWELLYRTVSGSFLGLGRRTPIVRYLDVPREIRKRRLPTRLRIVVVASQPHGVSPLDVQGEAEAMKALETRVEGLEVEILPHADLDTLRSFLLHQETDVVHFIGHGSHDPETGATKLYLEGPSREPEAVEAREIVDTLDGLDELRLVVLNACDTGRFGPVQPFSALAPALLRAGLPAVLAMQRPILDEAAVRFSDSLYRRLCAGDPIDSAVTEARMALSRRPSTSSAWPIPALFMRTPDGELFAGSSNEHENRDRGALLRPSWSAHLSVRNWEAARVELQRQRAVDPDAPLTTPALAAVLARGSHLRKLRYSTACEMHRLLVDSLDKPDDRVLAAVSLLGLKIDYFRANGVREPTPSLDEVLRVAAVRPLADDEVTILGCLKTTERVREIWSRLETMKGKIA